MLKLPPQAIGIFDSGVGGLSVLREIQLQLPDQPLIYLADSAYAPYGERSSEEIQARVLTLCDWLINQDVKALVIACNTATAHTIQILRKCYPNKPIIGIEPGIKPAQTLSTTGIIGVLATSNTLTSNKFCILMAELKKKCPTTQFICRAGTGLVPLIEQGQVNSPAINALLREYLEPMLAQNMDTLVLGCTHYVFLIEAIRQIIGLKIHLIDTSYAVTQRLLNQLTHHGLLTTSTHHNINKKIFLLASAVPERLNYMAKYLLNQELEVQHIII